MLPSKTGQAIALPTCTIINHENRVILLLVSLPVLLLAVLILAQVELDLAPYRDSINRLTAEPAS